MSQETIAKERTEKAAAVPLSGESSETSAAPAESASAPVQTPIPLDPTAVRMEAQTPHSLSYMEPNNEPGKPAEEALVRPRPAVVAPADFTPPDELYQQLVASVRKYHPSSDLSLIEMNLICPHSLFARPMLFAPRREISVTYRGAGGGGLSVFVDGAKTTVLRNMQSFTVTCSEHAMPFVDCKGHAFYDALNGKLMQPLKKTE